MIIQNLIQKLEDTRMCRSSRQDVSPDVTIEVNNPKTVIIPENMIADINALKRYIGQELLSGLCITVTLKEMLTICPRERKKTDAYARLVAFLKDELNVTLLIKSQKNKVCDCQSSKQD